MTKYTLIFGASLLVSLALSTASCQAETHQKSQSQVVPAVGPASSGSKHSLLGYKLTSVGQPKARSARSLSDMFERVKSRIFGSKKQSSGSASNQATNSVAASSPVQSSISASSQAAQRQPWDLNAFNQQFNPYATLSNGAYQWPSGSSINNQFMSPQFLGAQPTGMISGLDAISSSASSPSTSSSMQSANFNANGIAQQSSGSTNQAAGQAGGLLSSASHLIAQYLSPTSSNSGSGSGPALSGGQQFSQQQQPQQAAGVSLTPQQQQQQSTYQDFANILDGLVAQTTGGNGNNNNNNNNKFMLSQQQPGQTLQQSGASYPSGSISGAIGSSQSGDTDMAGSSNIQSYMPSANGAGVATPQQASQKSSMVGLAEQLAPGAQFNKLISFPFSLSSNDDQTKEGRYKLHIPFLNQHVKRSDDQAAQQQRAKSQQQQQQLMQQQQQMQQYLSSLYQQQQQPQQYVSQYGQPVAQSQQQSQLVAQPSQVVPTIVSPQAAPSASSNSPVLSSQSISTSVSSSSAVSQSQPSASASVASSNQSPSASSSSSASSSPSSSSSATNQRPSWSVSDTQSSAAVSSNKLIPMQTASAAALDSSDEPVAQS